MDTKDDGTRPEKPPGGPDIILEDEGVTGHPYASSLGIWVVFEYFFPELKSENKLEEIPKGHVRGRTVHGGS